MKKNAAGLLPTAFFRSGLTFAWREAFFIRGVGRGLLLAGFGGCALAFLAQNQDERKREKDENAGKAGNHLQVGDHAISHADFHPVCGPCDKCLARGQNRNADHRPHYAVRRACPMKPVPCHGLGSPGWVRLPGHATRKEDWRVFYKCALRSHPGPGALNSRRACRIGNKRMVGLHGAVGPCGWGGYPRMNVGHHKMDGSLPVGSGLPGGVGLQVWARGGRTACALQPGLQRGAGKNVHNVV